MHVQDSELEQYVRGQLSPSQISTVEAHLSQCESCGGRLAQAVKFVEQLAALSRAQQQLSEAGERRSSPRIPSNDPARLHLFNPFSTARSDVRVLDVSKHGLKLHVPEFLAPGSMVQIHLATSIALGEVRYCLPAAAGFHVGVRLEDVFENPPKTTGA
jgi:anti-sigma factor RsiW